MFALNLVKLFIVVVVVAVLWHAYRWVRAMATGQATGRSDGDKTNNPDAVEMKPCPVCGTYRPVKGASACEREDCPYR